MIEDERQSHRSNQGYEPPSACGPSAISELAVAALVHHTSLVSAQKKSACIALFLVLIGMAVYFITAEDEPTHDGKSLSYWLDKFDYHSNFADSQGRRSPEWHETVQAIRAIGTNAVPYLVRQLQKSEFRLKTLLVQSAQRWYGPIPVANRRKINFFKTDFGKKRDAIEALSILKAQATGAVPQLIVMLQSGDDRHAQLAADALTHIGPQGAAAVPALIEKLKQRKTYAFGAIEGIGSAAHEAVPILTTLMRDRDVNYRINAIWAIRSMGPSAADALPVLLSSLNDTNASVRSSALTAIGRIGIRTEPVLHCISVLTNDPDSAVSADAKRVASLLRSNP